jgi:hypothetical protein
VRWILRRARRRYAPSCSPPAPRSKFEFEYALRRRRVERMLTVVMEPRCLDTRSWTGAIGGWLGGRLFVDFTDDANLAAAVSTIAQEVRLIMAHGKAATPSRPAGVSHPQETGDPCRR